MRKLLFLLLIFVAVVLGALYLASGTLLDFGSRKAITLLAAKGADHGIELTEARLGKSELLSYKQAVWRDISARITFKKNSFFSKDQAVTLNIGRMNLRLVNAGTRSFLLQARGIRMVPEQKDSESMSLDIEDAPPRVDGEEMVLRFSLDPLNPTRAKAQVATLVSGLKDLIKTGTTPLQMYFNGTVTFPVHRRPQTARITIREGTHGSDSSLSMNELDLVNISQQMTLERPLSQEEISLLSANPIKAPRLLQIRDYARATSKQAAARNYSVPEDAYRHVLWSFLLTREYGPDFAKKVTDAHEKGMTGNTRNDTIMDRNNNTVGRSYAQRDAGEESILARVLSDPAVIRSADDVSGRVTR